MGSTMTTDRKLAQQIYVAKRSEYQKIEHGFERKCIKLADLMNDYLEIYAKHAKATYKSNIFMLKRMGKFFGDVFAHELTSADVEGYRGHRLSTGVSKSTVNREMALLKHVFNKGIEWEKCTDNPVRKIKFYSEKENKRTRYLEQHEKVRLLNACPTPTKRLVFFALQTGMRRGEILNLKWPDLDFNTNLICVRHSKARKPRFIPINSELENMLKSMPTASEYVFGTADGQAGFTLYRKPFETAMKKAGISDFRFHDLRHCFASDLVMKGVDLKTVSELLGHSSTAMTERYSHLSPAHKRTAVELLPKGLFYYADTTSALDEIRNFQIPINLPSIAKTTGQLAQLVEQATLNR